MKISMDGKSRWVDNRFIGRLWRSLKYESVYLEELTGGHRARRMTVFWLWLGNHYNRRHSHLALAGRMPAETYSMDREAALSGDRGVKNRPPPDPCRGQEA